RNENMYSRKRNQPEHLTSLVRLALPAMLFRASALRWPLPLSGSTRLTAFPIREFAREVAHFRFVAQVRFAFVRACSKFETIFSGMILHKKHYFKKYQNACLMSYSYARWT